MPRWLITVFTLHFLLSVGASAFGKTPAAELPPSQGAPAILVIANMAHTEPAPADPALAVDVNDHGLVDENQDLPDDQNIRLPLAGLGCTLALCPTQAAAPPRSPALKKRLRPPRASHVLRA